MFQSSQGSPREPSGAEESPGEPGRAQGSPGKHRKAREIPGGQESIGEQPESFCYPTPAGSAAPPAPQLIMLWSPLLRSHYVARAPLVVLLVKRLSHIARTGLFLSVARVVLLLQCPRLPFHDGLGLEHTRVPCAYL